MARQIWMDRMIEATRDAEIVMPWSRRPSATETPAPHAPVAAQSR